MVWQIPKLGNERIWFYSVLIIEYIWVPYNIPYKIYNKFFELISQDLVYVIWKQINILINVQGITFLTLVLFSYVVYSEKEKFFLFPIIFIALKYFHIIILYNCFYVLAAILNQRLVYYLWRTMIFHDLSYVQDA